MDFKILQLGKYVSRYYNLFSQFIAKYHTHCLHRMYNLVHSRTAFRQINKT